MSETLSYGQRIAGGRFVLVRQLGQGGMGVVWLATDTQLNEEVALKFLPPEIRGDAVALDTVRREAARSRQLSHPNIVRIHDVHVDDDGALLLSMEFVDGKNLNELRLYQPDRRFPWTTLVPWMKQLCEALNYAHGEKLIHRDLKPSNIMLDARGRVKLADFGISATAVDSMSRVSLRQPVSGTLAFMSPQQLDGRSPRVTDDVYSLGATVYDLLTGRPPFHSGDVPYQVRQLPPEPIQDRLLELGIEDDVPPAVSAMVMACLAKDPEQRPQEISDVAHWIGLSDSSVASGSLVSPGPEPAGAPRLRPRIWAWGSGLLAAAVLAGGGVWLWFEKQGSLNQSGALAGQNTASNGSEYENGFLPLLKGSDLSGWSGDSGVWSVGNGVVEGVLEGSKGQRLQSALVWTNGASSDLELRLRLRFSSEVKAYHGILAVGFRCSMEAPAAGRDSNYLTKFGGAERSRGAICRDGPMGSVLVWPGQSRTIRPGDERDLTRRLRVRGFNDPFRTEDWNDLIIVAQGNHVTVTVNGVRTAELFDEDITHSPEGSLVSLIVQTGLSGDKVQAQFRDLRLKHLPPP
jgi:serine/threonine protein kinase